MSLPEPASEPRSDRDEFLAGFCAQEAEWQFRAEQVQRRAAHAYARLMSIAEKSQAGQAERVARFLASTWDGVAYPYNLFDLRTFDVDIADDILLCLDALRWARVDLHQLIPDGAARMKAVVRLWSLGLQTPA